MERDSHRHIPARARATAALSAILLAATFGTVALAEAHGTQPPGTGPIVKKCATNAACIHGNNTSTGPGVEGDASQSFGVYGRSTGFNAGVGGYSYDQSAGASGVYGYSAAGYGVYGFTATSAGYGVVSDGNALVVGLLYTSGNCQSGCSRQKLQASFAAQSAQPTIDDLGEATIRNGFAHVPLAPDFANAIDPGKPYLVLLTPEGDASLYVAGRTTRGFDVRQVGGGHGAAAFAYRIVAKPFGAKNERLPFKSVPAAQPGQP